MYRVKISVLKKFNKSLDNAFFLIYHINNKREELSSTRFYKYCEDVSSSVYISYEGECATG